MKNTIKAIILATLLMSLTQLVSAAPPNDNWDNAIQLGSTTTGYAVGSVTGATLQPCETTTHGFPEEGSSPASKTVWYKWQAPASGSYTFYFNSSETGIDPVLSLSRLVQGLCNGNQMTLPHPLGANHNYNQELGLDQDSRITFRASAGEMFHIAVDSYTGVDGGFHMLWAKTKFRYDATLDVKNGGADLVVNRPVAGRMQWWTARYGSSNSFSTFNAQMYGLQNDRTLVGDYDGDGISEMVAVRQENGSSVWWIANKWGQVIRVVQFGLQSDKPIVGDYDGDGIADIAVVREDEGSNTRTWHILRSSDGQYTGVQFGLANDRPMAGDYDGDGRTDLVVQRAENNSLTWYIHRSGSNQVVSRVFGNDTGDFPVAADFDGDGKTDIGVFRFLAPASQGQAFNGYWFSLDSMSQLPLEQVPTRYQKFGEIYDVPQPADFDGDGRTDLAVFRTGQWWIRRSRDGQVVTHLFGNQWDYTLTDGGMFLAQHYY